MQNELNNQNHRQESSHLDHVKEQIDLLENASFKELNFKVKKLNFLCLNFDPFDFDTKEQEVKNILNEFKLEQYSNDPYLFTKVVLQLIDATENILNRRVN